MSPRGTRLSIAVVAVVIVLAMALAGVAGAAAGGAAVYVAVRDRLASSNAPALSATQPAAQPLPSSSSSSSPTTNVEQAAAEVGPSVVTVINHLDTTNLAPGSSNSSPTASGSGVVISSNGDIVTNNHVVEGARTLEVVTSDGKRLPAQLVGADPFSDLAVVHVQGTFTTVASFGESSALKPGETVIAIGSPLGDLNNTVTVGVVSAMNRSIETNNGYQMEGMIQTDAAINQGNSGGPLVNVQGQIIGINTLVVRGGSLNGAVAEGLGFAIPSDTVKAVTDQLIKTGQVVRPYMGIRWEWITPDTAAANNLKPQYGAFISEVTQGSPAAQAGLQQGDLLTGIDGTPFSADKPFLNVLLTHKPGDVVTFQVLRGSSTLDVQVRLGERPKA